MVYLTVLPRGLDGRERVRGESLCGWWLLLQALRRRGLAPPERSPAQLKASAVRGPNGKPALPETGAAFSIAHSRGLVACAVEDVPVGVDVERVRAFGPSLAARICAPGEVPLAAGEDRLLTQLWTCKESHMKYTGRGFSQGIAETAFSRLGPHPLLASAGAPAFFSSTELPLGERVFWLTECTQAPRDLELTWLAYPGPG